jgi:hypothetical protein
MVPDNMVAVLGLCSSLSQPPRFCFVSLFVLSPYFNFATGNSV